MHDLDRCSESCLHFRLPIARFLDQKNSFCYPKDLHNSCCCCCCSCQKLSLLLLCFLPAKGNERTGRPAFVPAHYSVLVPPVRITKTIDPYHQRVSQAM